MFCWTTTEYSDYQPKERTFDECYLLSAHVGKLQHNSPSSLPIDLSLMPVDLRKPLDILYYHLYSSLLVN
ncbi:hypothetical protein QOT17_001999 [Balamuthia mandrillaris]